MSVFTGKMLLEHGHDHSFTYCLRLLSLCKSGAVTDTIAHKAKRTCYLVLQKSLRTSALTREHFSPLFLRYLISNVFILDMHFSFILGNKTVAPSLSPPQKNLSFVNSIKNTYMIVDGRALTGLESQRLFIDQTLTATPLEKGPSASKSTRSTRPPSP